MSEWDYDKEYHELQTRYDALFDEAVKMRADKDKRITVLEQSNEALRAQVAAQATMIQELEDELSHENALAVHLRRQRDSADAITAWAMGFE